MKRNIGMFLLFFSLVTQSYTQTTIDEGMKYYFSKLIPNFYKGQQFFYDDESLTLLQKFGLHMQGDGFSQIQNSNSISFSFYLLLNHDKQDVQVVKLCQQYTENYLFEYWMLKLSDKGIPYNYGLFYITRTDNITTSREIVLKTRYFHDVEKFVGIQKMNRLSIDLVTLYWMEPWIEKESFKGSQYEDVIVKWHHENPYIRKLNLFEKKYYDRIKKTNRILE